MFLVQFSVTILRLLVEGTGRDGTGRDMLYQLSLFFLVPREPPPLLNGLLGLS